MKAQSADYIQLQNVYKSKARKDFAEVLADVRELETRLGRTYPIDEKEVEAFCKEAKSVKLVRGRALHMATAGTGSLRWNDRAQFACACERDSMFRCKKLHPKNLSLH